MTEWLKRSNPFRDVHTFRDRDVREEVPHQHDWELVPGGNPIRANLYLYGCPGCTKVICVRPGTDPYTVGD
jgi:hypothetical protein